VKNRNGTKAKKFEHSRLSSRDAMKYLESLRGGDREDRIRKAVYAPAVRLDASHPPDSAWELVDILRRSGLPDGVLNLVLGSGSELGASLTGSASTIAIRPR
jgi:hypothetical protein